jgi:uncharacterized protein YjbI with pentapeptide repeats
MRAPPPQPTEAELRDLAEAAEDVARMEEKIEYEDRIFDLEPCGLADKRTFGFSSMSCDTTRVSNASELRGIYATPPDSSLPIYSTVDRTKDIARERYAGHARGNPRSAPYGLKWKNLGPMEPSVLAQSGARQLKNAALERALEDNTEVPPKVWDEIGELFPGDVVKVGDSYFQHCASRIPNFVLSTGVLNADQLLQVSGGDLSFAQEFGTFQEEVTKNAFYLKWKSFHATKNQNGIVVNHRELVNPALATALQKKLESDPQKSEETVEFNLQEWLEIGIGDVGEGDCIQVGSSFFEPVLIHDDHKSVATFKFAVPHFVGPLPPDKLKHFMPPKHQVYHPWDPRETLVGLFQASHSPILTMKYEEETKVQASSALKYGEDDTLLVRHVNKHLKTLVDLPAVPTYDLSAIRFRDNSELCDLRAITFSGLKLCKARFDDCYMAGAQFVDCDLTGVTFKRCDMYAVKFRECILTGARMKSCCLDKMIVRHQHYNDVETQSEKGNGPISFAKSNKIGNIAIGRHVRLSIVDSTMQRAKIFGSLENADFDNVDATGTEFHGSYHSCSFSNSNFSGTRFNRAHLVRPYFGETLLQNASFDEAFLSEAEFIFDPKRHSRFGDDLKKAKLLRANMPPPLPLQSSPKGNNTAHELVKEEHVDYGLAFVRGWWDPPQSKNPHEILKLPWNQPQVRGDVSTLASSLSTSSLYFQRGLSVKKCPLLLVAPLTEGDSFPSP